MLLSLKIENFALIDQLELEFSSGLHVLTGETGAGKSILLDAIDAVLGGKVTNRAIRTGTERSSIEATFRLDPDLLDWLNQQEIGLLEEQALVCSREMTVSSGGLRSRSRLNGVLVNKQQMEELRDRLVEITAQGQTVQLGKSSMQRTWLDNFGGVPLLQQQQQVAESFSRYQQAQQALEKRRQSEQQRLQQLDLFEYQIQELSAANLEDPLELQQLEQERERLSHSVELRQQSYQVYQLLYQNDNGGEACADLLGQSESFLSEMVQYDEQIEPILDLVRDALAQIQEAGRQINIYGDAVETDPQRLSEVEERIAQLKQIIRKYGPTLGDAIALYQQLQKQLADLTGGGQSLEVLEEAYQASRAQLLKHCGQLSQLRHVAAQELQSRLLTELKPLAMDKVQFQVNITPCTPSATGSDQITFVFSPNPGEPLQPLAETASGGEMSRFLLALKACFSQVDPIGTLVFDEIDAGVSGRVAQAIAEKLYQLSQQHQVLCVTHQPIVAAMADYHLRVSKQLIEQAKSQLKLQNQQSGADNDEPQPLEEVRTVVRVTPLINSQQRREELAQIAAGQTSAPKDGSAHAAYAFADALLNQAATVRQTQAAASPAQSSNQPAAIPESKRQRGSRANSHNKASKKTNA